MFGRSNLKLNSKVTEQQAQMGYGVGFNSKVHGQVYVLNWEVHITPSLP